MSGALGLRYGAVELAPYTPEWRQAFETERPALERALAGVACRIEHVGSTAVPGMEAKPILDVAVGVEPPHRAEACVPRLEGIGYTYRGDAGAEGGHVLVRAEGRVRTHHVHVVALEDPQWCSYLAFRDYLIRDAAARERYRAVKRGLAARHPQNRRAYSHGKDAVVRELLARARSRA